MQGTFNSIENYESIEGTVIEYTFCRNGWFSTPEPDQHLDMSNPQLVADVTDALAQPDQTAGPAPDCPNDPPRWQLPVIVRTTAGMWFVHLPLLPCGQDPLYPVCRTANRPACGHWEVDRNRSTCTADRSIPSGNSMPARLAWAQLASQGVVWFARRRHNHQRRRGALQF